MSVAIEFHPEAADEAVEAQQRYAEQSEKTAERFLAEVQRALEKIGEFPDRYPRHSHGTRVFLLRRFPYLIIYKAYADHVKIVVVAHGKRKPGYWKHRVTK
jgi:plasmid stabilization system protein ParE